MERDFETNSSHFCTSRTSLWCPVCGAKEGQGCTAVHGLRFTGHDAYAMGAYRPLATPAAWEPMQARKDAPRPSSGLRGWVQ